MQIEMSKLVYKVYLGHLGISMGSIEPYHVLSEVWSDIDFWLSDFAKFYYQSIRLTNIWSTSESTW